ncbi:MAG: HvfC/BufC family peptide modification chaperone [Bacteroidota bacterium]
MGAIPLKKLQQWMQSVIEHPGTDDEAWNSKQAADAISGEDAMNAVLPSKTLTSAERIAIYRRMFFLRMTESMQIDYPGVLHALGEQEFNRLISEEYVRRYPSQSYTLNHLGRHFPEFIGTSQIPGKEFLSDLARLELSITNIMDADESPTLTQEVVSAIPPERWNNAVLIPIAALELMRFQYSVDEYLDAVNDEKPVPAVRKEPTYVVVYRREFITYWKSISADQYHLLKALTKGKTLSESFDVLTHNASVNTAAAQENVFRWFGEWMTDGFFSGIQW